MVDNHRNHGKFESNVKYPLVFEEATEIPNTNDEDIRVEVSFSEGKLYTSDEICLVCFDTTTKKKMWEIKKNSIYTPIPAERNRIYITADNTLLCLNANNSETVWKTDVDYFPIAASKDFIYCRDSLRDTNIVLCYSKETGEELWRLKTHGPFNLAATENGLAIFQGFEGYHVYEEATGKLLWETTRTEWKKKYLKGLNYSGLDSLGPVIDGVIYIGIEGGFLATMHVWSGELLWVYDLGDKYRMPYRVFVHQDKVYFVTDPGSWSNNYLRCLDIKTGELIYKSEEPLTPEGHRIPIMTNNYIIGGSGKYLSFFDVEKQEFVWRYKHKKKASLGYPIAYKDQLICYNNSAKKIYWFKNKPQKKKKAKK